MKTKLFLLFVVACLLDVAGLSASQKKQFDSAKNQKAEKKLLTRADSKTAKLTVVEFYKKYLDKKSQKVRMQFSQSFEELSMKEYKACKKMEGVCGWAASGDIYLNAQEIDPNLSYENARMKIDEQQVGRVEVRMNVYPSVKDTEGYYDRLIVFLMIKQNNRWVVDDILYEGKKSVKKDMQETVDALAREKPSSRL